MDLGFLVSQLPYTPAFFEVARNIATSAETAVDDYKKFSTLGKGILFAAGALVTWEVGPGTEMFTAMVAGEVLETTGNELAASAAAGLTSIAVQAPIGLSLAYVLHKSKGTVKFLESIGFGKIASKIDPRKSKLAKFAFSTSFGAGALVTTSVLANPEDDKSRYKLARSGALYAGLGATCIVGALSTSVGAANQGVQEKVATWASDPLTWIAAWGVINYFTHKHESTKTPSTDIINPAE